MAATQLTSFMTLRVHTRQGYGCAHGTIWVHLRVDMGSHESAVMGLESQAVSARVTKHYF